MIGVAAAGRQLRIVGQDRARPDDDGVALPAKPVSVGASLLAGDPPAAAVGCGYPSVEGRCVLPGDERPAGADREQPLPQGSGRGLVGVRPAYLDAGRLQYSSPTASRRCAFSYRRYRGRR